jgi:hypothetical protein
MYGRTKLVIGIAIASTLIFMAACKTAETKISNYAEDRALIEDLQARYMFALDFGDMDKYVSTFAEDGILDIGDGEMKGRAEIKKIFSLMPAKKEPSAAEAKLRPATGRHNISNIVIKVEGNKANGRAYWFHYGNNTPQRTPGLDSYGHYEDEMVKINGNWLFSKRKIYNEQVDKWAAKKVNPSW